MGPYVGRLRVSGEKWIEDITEDTKVECVFRSVAEGGQLPGNTALFGDPSVMAILTVDQIVDG